MSALLGHQPIKHRAFFRNKSQYSTQCTKHLLQQSAVEGGGGGVGGGPYPLCYDGSVEFIAQVKAALCEAYRAAIEGILPHPVTVVP